ncbi:hypothetical protein O3M35_006302 [Rhynocoris fuscipes]|uniref:Uncharacterized protein n=1 Tax=Rhynocoris fuscipes TaxID=488301 RepID=A0AAW1DDQ0_9HEMI
MHLISGPAANDNDKVSFILRAIPISTGSSMRSSRRPKRCVNVGTIAEYMIILSPQAFLLFLKLGCVMFRVTICPYLAETVPVLSPCPSAQWGDIQRFFDISP